MVPRKNATRLKGLKSLKKDNALLLEPKMGIFGILPDLSKIIADLHNQFRESEIWLDEALRLGRIAKERDVNGFNEGKYPHMGEEITENQSSIHRLSRIDLPKRSTFSAKRRKPIDQNEEIGARTRSKAAKRPKIDEESEFRTKMQVPKSTTRIPATLLKNIKPLETPFSAISRQKLIPSIRGKTPEVKKRRQEEQEDLRRKIEMQLRHQEEAIRIKEEATRFKIDKSRKDREEKQRRAAENRARQRKIALEKAKMMENRRRAASEMARNEQALQMKNPLNLPKSRSPWKKTIHKSAKRQSSSPKNPNDNFCTENDGKSPKMEEKQRNDEIIRPERSLRAIPSEMDARNAIESEPLRLLEEEKARRSEEIAVKMNGIEAEMQEKECELSKKEPNIPDMSTSLKLVIPRLAALNSSLIINASVAATPGPNSSRNYEMSFLVPPKAKSEDDYGIDDLDSGDETDDDRNPKKSIPKWATGAPLKAAIIYQYHNPPDIERIFGLIRQPSLTELFGKKGYKKRTSSACWDSPLWNPTKSVKSGKRLSLNDSTISNL